MCFGYILLILIYSTKTPQKVIKHVFPTNPKKHQGCTHVYTHTIFKIGALKEFLED